MQISIIGTHGSGKTTVVSRLHNLLSVENKTHVIIREVARLCPFPVGKTSSKLSQDWILNTQKYLEDNCSNMCCPVISDRNMIDQYAYYVYWVGEDVTIERELTHRYDCDNLVFLMAANPDYLTDDGLRPTDIKFQEEISSIVLHILDKLRIYDRCDVVLFDKNSIDEIVDAIESNIPGECMLKTTTNAKYSYDRKFFEKIIQTNNLPLNNLAPEYFDEIFYRMVVLPRKR